eukprot:CAMPEP_0170406836 /NCGR_PEP_ID=MMETSP0117_2-20130122/27933_1 /TAXON_ID=400756 /ORGANISM="Durinskia baltica, Strain CSIRO CS-38" /LENGTH=67 /DNA_ID=CAMNT_0010664057 /DNA_START=71 /DNA_END=271 /DNA_ORIENTATION=+
MAGVQNADSEPHANRPGRGPYNSRLAIRATQDYEEAGASPATWLSRPFRGAVHTGCAKPGALRHDMN